MSSARNVRKYSLKSLAAYSCDYVKQNSLGAIAVAFVLILAYGFYASHYSFNLDQLVPSYYDGDTLITAGRWGAPLIHIITNCMEFSPFWQTIMMMLLLWISGLFWLVLFSNAANSKLHPIALFSFWAVFPVYPMLAEQLTYPNLNIALAYVFTPTALWLMYPFIIDGKIDWRNLLLAIAFMLVSVDMYESFAPVFITGVFSALILHYLYGQDGKPFLARLLRALAVTGSFLVVVIVLDFVISKMVCFFVSGSFKFWYKTNSTTKWGAYGGIIDSIVWFLRSALAHYFVAGAGDISVFLFDAMLLAAIIGGVVLSIKKQSVIPLLLFGGLSLASVSLAVILCESPSYRMEQALPVYVAFMWMLVAEFCSRKKLLSVVFSSLLILLILAETQSVNNYAVRNYEIFEYQYTELREIGEALERYGTSNKHVAFIVNDDALLMPRTMAIPKTSGNPIRSAFRAAACNFWNQILPNRYFENANYLFWSYSNINITDTDSLIKAIKSYSIIYFPYLGGLIYNQFYTAEGYMALDRMGYPVLPCTEEEYQEAQKYLVEEDDTCEFKITETDDLIVVQLMSIPWNA